MKKNDIMVVALAMTLGLAGCGAGSGAATASSTTGESSTAGIRAEQKAAPTPVAIKSSPDKYTWYVKNYVGMNAASVGYTALDGIRRDTYGAGVIKVVFATEDGTYLPLDDEDETLKNYVVYGQSLEPNTEIKLTFKIDSDGEEYGNLTDTINYEQIILDVKKVGDPDGAAVCMTAIDSSPDKYNRVVRDYTGLNLRNCGYASLGGDRMDTYGSASVTLNIIASDGSYIDPTDEEALALYRVDNQSVAANTPIGLVFSKDSNGEEYDNLVESKTLESIDLYVSKIQ